MTRPYMQEIDLSIVAKQPTFTRALQLTVQMSGLDHTDFHGPNGIVKDAAQWSRIISGTGTAYFPQDKLNEFMNVAGNEVPLLWLLHSRGYDTESLRLRESILEEELRVAKEALTKEREKNRVLAEALNGRVSA